MDSLWVWVCFVLNDNIFYKRGSNLSSQRPSKPLLGLSAFKTCYRTTLLTTTFIVLVLNLYLSFRNALTSCLKPLIVDVVILKSWTTVHVSVLVLASLWRLALKILHLYLYYEKNEGVRSVVFKQGSLLGEQLVFESIMAFF